MIKIELVESHRYLKFNHRAIIIHELDYSVFVDNLYVLTQGNRVKIKPEELSFVDFNLIYHKHIPEYKDYQQPKLDIAHLLQQIKWVSKVIISPERE